MANGHIDSDRVYNEDLRMYVNANPTPAQQGVARIRLYSIVASLPVAVAVIQWVINAIVLYFATTARQLNCDQSYNDVTDNYECVPIDLLVGLDYVGWTSLALAISIVLYLLDEASPVLSNSLSDLKTDKRICKSLFRVAYNSDIVLRLVGGVAILILGCTIAFSIMAIIHPR